MVQGLEDLMNIESDDQQYAYAATYFEDINKEETDDSNSELESENNKTQTIAHAIADNLEDSDLDFKDGKWPAETPRK